MPHAGQHIAHHRAADAEMLGQALLHDADRGEDHLDAERLIGHFRVMRGHPDKFGARSPPPGGRPRRACSGYCLSAVLGLRMRIRITTASSSRRTALMEALSGKSPVHMSGPVHRQYAGSGVRDMDMARQPSRPLGNRAIWASAARGCRGAPWIESRPSGLCEPRAKMRKKKNKKKKEKKKKCATRSARAKSQRCISISMTLRAGVRRSIVYRLIDGEIAGKVAGLANAAHPLLHWRTKSASSARLEALKRMVFAECAPDCQAASNRSVDMRRIQRRDARSAPVRSSQSSTSPAVQGVKSPPAQRCA